MKSHTMALLVAALLLVAWAWERPGAQFVDLGDGLLMRADGSVLAVWELPECAFAGDMFEVAENAGAMLASSQQVWRMRFDRGW
jgi:hypothetical protein